MGGGREVTRHLWKRAAPPRQLLFFGPADPVTDQRGLSAAVRSLRILAVWRCIVGGNVHLLSPEVVVRLHDLLQELWAGQEVRREVEVERRVARLPLQLGSEPSDQHQGGRNVVEILRTGRTRVEVTGEQSDDVAAQLEGRLPCGTEAQRQRRLEGGVVAEQRDESARSGQVLRRQCGCGSFALSRFG